MDATSEELQAQELTALKSIYAEDFIDIPPPKAWKSAIRPIEFNIKIIHHKVSLLLNVRFPKTYPKVACPTFTIHKPHHGLTTDQISKLTHAIHDEALTQRGSEMVFHIVSFCQEWLSDNVPVTHEVSGSLAVQMNQRAEDEARLREQKAREDAERELALELKRAKELEEQMEADAQRQHDARKRTKATRKRAGSESTEMGTDIIPTEAFDQIIEFKGIRFDTVKFFRPQQHHLGIRYVASPVSDDLKADTLPLELYVVTFESYHYTTTQGRKKIAQLEAEIRRLTTIRHDNVLSVLAVKLRKPQSGSPPQLIVLSEQCPPLTLQDVLQDSESLREDRATDYLSQILVGLLALHFEDMLHRGIDPASIGLASRDHPIQPKLIKLCRVGFYTRLSDLNRSNSFSNTVVHIQDSARIPDAWLYNNVKESALIYTQHRDIHAVGLVFLQMLLGLRVMEQYPDAQTALHRSLISPQLQKHIMNMLQPPKKPQISCTTLLNALAQHSPTRSPTIPVPDLRTPMPANSFGSPEPEYFKSSVAKYDRWKQEWDILDTLGEGGFGAVYKARNRGDSRIYAVKKIRVKKSLADVTVSREIDALATLSHPNIVRYYATWSDDAESLSAAPSDDSNTGSEYSDVTADGYDFPSLASSRAPSRGRSDGSQSLFSLHDDFDEPTRSKGSFPSIVPSIGPSIVFSNENGEESSEEDTDSEDGRSIFATSLFEDIPGTAMPSAFPQVTKVTKYVYIQMEFVEQQTLRERLAGGIEEEEAWRLFKQIVDALVYMANQGILHRDIKLTNIFIDRKGDCKVGDFGLATTVGAVVDPSDGPPRATTNDPDMTLNVGTTLYIAPEIQSRRRGKNYSKADMYSLGIVFFEMNVPPFTTSSERIVVVESLRKPGIFFPPSWDPARARQRQIITWLLQHDPEDRPTALELSQSPLLPHGLEEENFRSALALMAKPDSPHHEAMLASLFEQIPKRSRSFLYDAEIEANELSSVTSVVMERLAAIFRLHGAVDMEPPLLMSVFDTEQQTNQATFVDRHGGLVTLPNNAIVPFARLAAKVHHTRIKRYHIKDTYRPNTVAGHPTSHKAAIFDIITPDLQSGHAVSSAELVAVADRILKTFPNLDNNFDIHISHTRVVELMLDRIPATLRPFVLDTMDQSKASASQKRSILLKKGVLRSAVDELESLSEVDDIDIMMKRLERTSPTFTALIRPFVEDIRTTIQYSVCAGVKRPILFHPLMLGGAHGQGYNNYFKDGVIIEVVRRNKRGDVLAAGGRYDHLIDRYSVKSTRKSEPIAAYGMQISLDKIKAVLAAWHASLFKTWVNNKDDASKSFGFWSRKRCDVYIVSSSPGALKERLEIAAHLWEHGISADLMYEQGLYNGYADIAASEGIQFLLYPPLPHREQPLFRVKRILTGEEAELTKQALVPWLHQEIAEQRRADSKTAGLGVTVLDTLSAPNPPTKSNMSVVQQILPGAELKKQRKQVKHIFEDRAFETAEEVKKLILKPDGGMPTLSIDVPPVLFDALVSQSPSLWTHTDKDDADEAWKSLLAVAGGAVSNGYGAQIRDAICRRKTEGYKFIMVYAVREERMQLLQLS